ncbi:LysE family translocator [Aliidiomarina haloalkalitolerans]|uniref:Lysine transporter LysE n=1 Tax=Aliidiomarina haloalkalitolerans TaxID=859059 RepID=A0A432VY61_9GAMM|nr:LysE family translocator [Aliidiomarina haloalkalitolerans]MCL4409797.1 LysE family translocator [Gammaproteobacteria bacterium]RUO21631.1 lysine transporter LysE [Aliidiomarina haloalkalitolerans]
MFDELFSNRYAAEFIAMAIAHAFAVASPGPDFAVVSRYSIRHGTRVAVWVSFGIALGILVHVTYSILGLALVIHQTPWLYQLLMLVAASYFFWLGWQAMRSQPPTETNEIEVTGFEAEVSARRAVVIGFFTNGLNVKATMFFLALFTSIIATTTPVTVKAGYGIYLACATFAWFATLSYLLGRSRVRQTLLKKGYWFDRIMGGILWLLAMNLVWMWLQGL